MAKKVATKKKTVRRRPHKKKAHLGARSGVPRKKASKKTASKKKASKKKASKKKASKKKVASKKATGYITTRGGILVPNQLSEPVSTAKIRSGISKAKDEIRRLIDDLSELTDGFEVSEIELAASFSAEGKFLGIGVGGATTIAIRFGPSNA